MVPKFSITSSRVIPIPLSEIDRVPASLFTQMRTPSSPSPAYKSGFSNALKRSLSAASDALEISSLKKISLLEYKEWIIKCRICLTSD